MTGQPPAYPYHPSLQPSAGGAIARWADALVPSERRSDPEQLRVARLLAVAAPVASLLIAATVVFGAGAGEMTAGPAWTLSAVAATFGLVPLALWLGVAPRLVGRGLPALGVAAAVVAVALDGGLGSEVVLWLPLAPLGAALVAGEREALVLAIATCASLVGFVLAPQLIAGATHSAADLARCVAAVGSVSLGTALGIACERARHRSLATVWRLATHSGLTGLPGRALFRDRLERGLAGCERSGRPMAVVYLDVDRLKLVNDSFGHHRGDVLLGMVAARLRAATRGSEVPYHLSGDEFAVVCDGSSRDSLRALIARLDAALSVPARLGDRVADVAVSAGGDLSRPGDTATSLLQRADDAMSAAKRRRRAAGGLLVAGHERVLH